MPLNTNKDYMVEISYTKTKMLIIAARKIKHLVLEFPRKQGKKLVEQVGGSYETLLEYLNISK